MGLASTVGAAVSNWSNQRQQQKQFEDELERRKKEDEQNAFDNNSRFYEHLTSQRDRYSDDLRDLMAKEAETRAALAHSSRFKQLNPEAYQADMAAWQATAGRTKELANRLDATDEAMSQLLPRMVPPREMQSVSAPSPNYEQPSYASPGDVKGSPPPVDYASQASAGSQATPAAQAGAEESPPEQKPAEAPLLSFWNQQTDIPAEMSADGTLHVKARTKEEADEADKARTAANKLAQTELPISIESLGEDKQREETAKREEIATKQSDDWLKDQADKYKSVQDKIRMYEARLPAIERAALPNATAAMMIAGLKLGAASDPDNKEMQGLLADMQGASPEQLKEIVKSMREQMHEVIGSARGDLDEYGPGFREYQRRGAKRAGVKVRTDEDRFYAKYMKDNKLGNDPNALSPDDAASMLKAWDDEKKRNGAGD